MGRKVRYDTNFNEKMRVMLLARIILVVLVGLAVFMIPTFVKLVTFYAENYNSVFRFVIGFPISLGGLMLMGAFGHRVRSGASDAEILVGGFLWGILGACCGLYGMYLGLQFFLEYPLFSILCFAIVASIGGTGGRYAFGYSSKGGFGWFYFI